MSGSKSILLLPLENDARIAQKSHNYLSDLVWSSFTEQTPEGVALITRERAEAAARDVIGKKSGCDETCATEAGKALQAQYVVLPQLLRLGKELRCAFKLIDVQTGEMRTMKRALGGDLGEMEVGIPAAITALLQVVSGAYLEEEKTPLRHEGPYWAELLVEASGVKVDNPNTTPIAVQAAVYINGRKVGHTPYADGLPAGRYRVTIQYQNGQSKFSDIQAVAGGSYTIESRFVIPLTQADLVSRLEEKRAKEAAVYLDWKRRHKEWEEKTKDLSRKRRSFLMSGGGLLIGSGAALIAGSVLMVSASKDQDDLDALYAAWSSATIPEDIDYYEAEFRDAEKTRNNKKGSGIALLSTAGVAAVSGFVLMFLAPEIPKPPKRPPGTENVELRGVSLLPDPTRRAVVAAVQFSF